MVAIHPNCLRIALKMQLIHNPQDCKILFLDCGRIAKGLKMQFLGLRGIERIAEDPRTRMGAGARVRAPA